MGYEGAGVNVGLKDPQSKIRSAVPAYLSKSPLLIVLDEAHHYEPESLKQLFRITQDCMSENLPIALLVAGTPVLESLLSNVKATYVERSKYLRINTLSNDEAKEALEVPAREDGQPLDQDALELLLKWSDNYPYFIQLVGSVAWNVSTERGGNSISLADAEEGLELAVEARDEFYGRRRMELLRIKMVGYAKQAARIIQEAKGGQIDVEVFMERLVGMNDGMEWDFAINILDSSLQEDGYIWMNKDWVEAGIPSMFDYMLQGRKLDLQ